MVFHSSEFLIFLLTIFLCYWGLGKNFKTQNKLLLAASYFFYGWWDWRFLFLLLFSSLLDYVVGLNINKSNDNKRNWLMLSIICNIAVLSFFKYFNFFIESFQVMAAFLGFAPNEFTLSIILPVGISFYTFQSLSYTIDIYRGSLKPTKNLVSFLAFISFFPQLVAGPIERASNLLPQIEGQRKFHIDLFNEGVLQILVGLFRKIVIADTLAIYVDSVFATPQLFGATTILLASFFFAFQIYYDFAGYSDMAIGIAKLFGFRFHQNFALPYFSKSVTSFWRKWHISFSTWLRDYIYIPLGGNRNGLKRTYFNVVVTMLVGGLWHGAAWSFVLWGGLHGIVLAIEKWLGSKRWKFANGNLNWFGYIYSFSLIVVLLIIFRSNSLEATLVCAESLSQFTFELPFIGDASVMGKSIVVLTFGLALDAWLKFKSVDLENLGSCLPYTGLVSLSVVILIITVLFYSGSNSFIYFNF